MNSQSDKFKTYLFKYQHEGATWGFDVQASSLEDAKARLSKISRAQYEGILSISIPVSSGLFTWIYSLLRRKSG